MYNRILIPLDGSKTAEKVLPQARYLARALKVRVELLAVVDIGDMAIQISEESARPTTVIEKVVRDAETYLNRTADSFADKNVKCTIEKGKAADAIVEKAGTDKATLIAMATHGRSGVNRWLLGSVAEKVLRGALNPVLLTRATEKAATEGEAAFKSVTLPLDGSKLAEKVLPTVAELARSLKLEVILFRAYTLPYSAYAPVEGYQPAPGDFSGSVREEAVAYLDNQAEAMRDLGVEKVSCLVQEGAPADEIISLGNKNQNNLIAMCTHGRTGVKRWVLGSVTETVVRHSTDPMLVIRAM